MNNIIEPDDTFDFSKLSLAHPSGVQGGAYFTKIEYNNKPLYVQTIKSLTKQGFIKNGKKYYCDLMFDKNAESLIRWFENLEEKCQKLIYEKRESWFQNNLEETDIETAFNSLIRVYKSGKYYLVRTNIRTTRNDEPAVKLYNENEIALSIHDVTPDTHIISILEIQGIKFSSRNFQIEIELKQVMVLDNEPLFDNCLIKSLKNGNGNTVNGYTVDGNTLDKDNKTTIQDIQENQLQKEDMKDNNEYKDKDKNKENNVEPDKNNEIDIHLDTNTNNIDSSIATTLEKAAEINVNESSDNNSILELDLEELIEEEEKEPKELTELDIKDIIHLENKNEEVLQLKKPNQVYFELYKEARKKAKEAKRNAIIAYLEAKNIKKTYMIENINDDDSEIDAEIDEVSESELSNL
jgi:hypothetical protein